MTIQQMERGHAERHQIKDPFRSQKLFQNQKQSVNANTFTFAKHDHMIFKTASPINRLKNPYFRELHVMGNNFTWNDPKRCSG